MGIKFKLNDGCAEEEILAQDVPLDVLFVDFLGRTWIKSCGSRYIRLTDGNGDFDSAVYSPDEDAMDVSGGFVQVVFLPVKKILSGVKGIVFDE